MFLTDMRLLCNYCYVLHSLFALRKKIKQY